MIGFCLMVLLTLAGAVAAMTLRHLVHCALSLVVTFAGLAALYLHLNAEFVGFAQILVYIGAVAMLILFAVLLTRAGLPGGQPLFSGSWLVGAGIALLVFGALTVAILSTPLATAHPAKEPHVPVKDLGTLLMTAYVLPLEIIALLLTAALIGAVVIAMPEANTPKRSIQVQAQKSAPAAESTSAADPDRARSFQPAEH